MDSLIPISCLPRGHFASVGHVKGQPDHVHRLSELGLHGGSRIQMFRPGNPCIIYIAGSKVCIRSDRLLQILVKPNGTPSC